jgi:RNA polymerase sigma-70 factor (ECF subfamily)
MADQVGRTFLAKAGGLMASAPQDVSVLLAQLIAGQQEALPKLIPLVYDELHRLAAGYMRRERADHTLQATALVNEAYLKLVQQPCPNWHSRAHFFGVAAQVMRHILVDHARGHASEKRGGGKRPVALEDDFVFTSEKSIELLKLDTSLKRLAALDPRQARVVELRFFGGLTVEEVADVLGVSQKTVKRDWSMAKAWLHGDLKERV